jgi:uncharacterized membrane protein YjgN (DUF898 family)
VDLFKIKTVIMFIVSTSMMILGSYMIYEGMIHEVGGDAESHAEVAIMHMGKVSGSERIIIMAFGMLLIFMAAKFMWRINLRDVLKRGRKFKDITHYVTDTGREIARRMSKNKP